MSDLCNCVLATVGLSRDLNKCDICGRPIREIPAPPTSNDTIEAIQERMKDPEVCYRHAQEMETDIRTLLHALDVETKRRQELEREQWDYSFEDIPTDLGKFKEWAEQCPSDPAVIAYGDTLQALRHTERALDDANEKLKENNLYQFSQTILKKADDLAVTNAQLKARVKELEESIDMLDKPLMNTPLDTFTMDIKYAGKGKPNIGD